MSAKTSFLTRMILWRPGRIHQNLERIRQAQIVDPLPNLWQLSLGVLRMWHRLFFRSETIGLSCDHPVRSGWRARLFCFRPIRFPFLLWEGSVAPFDLTGLMGTSDRLIRHLLGTHHEGEQFVYDLEILFCTPGALERLEEEARRVVEVDDRRSRWLRDLVVYEEYHETLLAEVVAWRQEGIRLTDQQKDDADISLRGYLSWCAKQPATPGETWQAWRRGGYSVGEGRRRMEEGGRI